MSVLYRIACLQDRRDEAPNQELAREPAERKDKAGIREIAEYADDFLKLFRSRNNRLALSASKDAYRAEIFPHLPTERCGSAFREESARRGCGQQGQVHRSARKAYGRFVRFTKYAR